MPVYTGEQEREERDVNPGSPTFGQARWMEAGLNTTACPLPSRSYSSAAISATIYRTDCGPGGVSSGALYNLPAGHVVSTISQDDADTQAQAYFNATSYGFSLTACTCSAAPTTPGGSGSGLRTCQLIGPTIRGCWTGLMVDDSGATFAPTLQECSECNGQQDPSCGSVAC